MLTLRKHPWQWVVGAVVTVISVNMFVRMTVGSLHSEFAAAETYEGAGLVWFARTSTRALSRIFDSLLPPGGIHQPDFWARYNRWLNGFVILSLLVLVARLLMAWSSSRPANGGVQERRRSSNRKRPKRPKTNYLKKR